MPDIDALNAAQTTRLSDPPRPYMPMEAMPEEPTGLRRLVVVVTTRLTLIAAVTMACVVVAVVFAWRSPATYTAQASLGVLPAPTQPPYNSLTFLAGEGGGSTRDVETLAQVATSNDVAAIAAASIGGSPATLEKSVVATPVGLSYVVRISATASNAQRAAQVANAFAAGTVTRLDQQFQASVRSQTAQTQSQLANAAAGTKVTLETLLTQLQGLKGVSNPSIVIEAQALPPTSASSPSIILVTLAGLLGGFVLAVGVAVVVDVLDRRVRDERDLMRVFHLPVVARVTTSGSGDDQRDSGELVALAQMLIAEPDTTPLRTIAFAGVSEGDSTPRCAARVTEALRDAGPRILYVNCDRRAGAPTIGGDGRRNGRPDGNVEVFAPDGDAPASRHLEAAQAYAAKKGFDIVIAALPAIGGRAEGLGGAVRADEVILVAQPWTSNQSDLQVVAERMRGTQIRARGLVTVGFRSPNGVFA